MAWKTAASGDSYLDEDIPDEYFDEDLERVLSGNYPDEADGMLLDGFPEESGSDFLEEFEETDRSGLQEQESESIRSEETLDDFYFWGELLISDFDDVDKNLVDANRLFCNLQDLKNIMDNYDFLDKEQEEAIQQFFQNFSIDKRTQLKEKFISLWDKLGDIYRHYRKNLSELGIAYEA